MTTGYDHTQRGMIHWLLLVLAAAGVASGVALLGRDEGAPIVIAVSTLFGLAAACFAHLRVHDRGDTLRIQFGPLRVFGRSIRYGEIVEAEPGRSALIDGWGIHWMPGRGWTWNLHGFDCVELTLAGGRRMRIGTDDPGGLAAFLQTRIGAPTSRI